MIKQIPWFERQFNLNLPVGMFPIVFSRLEGSIFRLQKILSEKDEITTSQSTGSWTVKEHLGHLYDLEDLWWNRLTNFQNGDAMLTVADLNNTKTITANHNNKSLHDLLLIFIAERQKMLERIFDFDETFLIKTSLHPRLNQPMNVLDSLYFIAEHDDHHIAHISTLLRYS